MSRSVQLALLIGVFVAALLLLFLPVQRQLNDGVSGSRGFLVSAIFILPFLVVPLMIRPLQRATRIAWILAAVMALDLVFWVFITFAPTGGHPSFEAMGSLMLGMLKPILVTVGVVLLSVGFRRGERFVVVALGFVCLLAEALYGFYPIDMLLRHS
jgi:hypothetical protein